jgi:hypothetical protein
VGKIIYGLHWGQPLVEYKDVPGFPGYKVGDDGSVWSFRNCGSGYKKLRDVPRAVKKHIGKHGYPYVGLSKSGRTYRKDVHKLVMLAFIGPRPPGGHTRHLDGDPSNSALSNLCYGSPAENAADRIRHGDDRRGERRPSAKLTEKDVVWMRLGYSTGKTVKEMAKVLGVSVYTLYSAMPGSRNWKHVK